MEYKNIYNQAFATKNYNAHDCDEFRYQYALNHIKNNPNIGSVIDIGSGRGTLIKMIKDLNPNIHIKSVDLNNYHNLSDVDFINCDLLLGQDREKISSVRQDLLVCLDVMEHLQKNELEYIFQLFSEIAPYAIISIANHSDILNGTELHTIQEDMDYWLPIICKYFDIINLSTNYIQEDGKIRLSILLIRSKQNKSRVQKYLCSKKIVFQDVKDFILTKMNVFTIK